MTTAFADSNVTLGRYEPIAQIGRGGMAEVVLAMFQAGAGGRRLAVLKRIWPELTSDPDFVTMFVDEARLSVRLNHPNVVQTYEVLVSGDELAIAMEYLDGQPLVRLLNRLRDTPDDLPLPLRLRIIAGVLAGLEHAHTLADLDGRPLGVVHRDVSPHNVFVTYDGQIKLVDFGVAKTVAAAHRTRPGALKGKVAYMAPEQVRGTKVDARADLFAVGVMLWEMLAGRRIWQDKHEVGIVDHLASARLMPMLPHDSNLPMGLDAICVRALEPDPDLRYQTAAEMEFDIQCVLAGSADSHPRQLGQLLSMAFADERAERQAVIDRHLREDDLQARIAAPRPSTAPRQSAGRIAAADNSSATLNLVTEDLLPISPAARAGDRSYGGRAVQTASLVAATLLGVLVGGWRAEARRGGDVKGDLGGDVRGHAPDASRAASPASPLTDAPKSEPAVPPAASPGEKNKRTGNFADEETRRRHPRRRAHLDEDDVLPPSRGLPPNPDPFEP